jgi:hypothetical protein
MNVQGGVAGTSFSLDSGSPAKADCSSALTCAVTVTSTTSGHVGFLIGNMVAASNNFPWFISATAGACTSTWQEIPSAHGFNTTRSTFVAMCNNLAASATSITATVANYTPSSWTLTFVSFGYTGSAAVPTVDQGNTLNDASCTSCVGVALPTLSGTSDVILQSLQSLGAFNVSAITGGAFTSSTFTQFDNTGHNGNAGTVNTTNVTQPTWTVASGAGAVASAAAVGFGTACSDTSFTDFSGTNAATVTAATMAAETFGAEYVNASTAGVVWVLTNATPALTISNAWTPTYLGASYPNFCLGGQYSNQANLKSLKYADASTVGQNVTMFFPGGDSYQFTNQQGNTATALYYFNTTIPSATSFSKIDQSTVSDTGGTSDFYTTQLQGSGSALTLTEECGGTCSTPNLTITPNTQYEIGTQYNSGGTHYSAYWDASGNMLQTTRAPAVGGVPGKFFFGGVTNPGPAGGYVQYMADLSVCYALGGQTPCQLPPVGAGLQLLTPTLSPAPGYYASGTPITITIAQPGTATGSTIADCYTLTGSAPTAPTAGTCGSGSTKYTGGFSQSTTATVEALATQAGNLNSAVVSGLYTFTSSAFGTTGVSLYSTGCTNATGCSYTIGNYTTGDMTIAAACATSAITFATPTDTAGNTYTSREAGTSGNGSYCQAWTGAGGTTHSANAITVKPSSTASINVTAENVTQISTGFDVASTMKANGSSSGATLSANAMTTGHTDYVWCWMYDAGAQGGTPTAGSGYTLLYTDTTWPISGDYQVAVGAGSVTGSFGWTTSHGFIGCLAVY